jgi:hypothetical protein
MTYLKKIDRPGYMLDLSRRENCPEKPYGVMLWWGYCAGTRSFQKNLYQHFATLGEAEEIFESLAAFAESMNKTKPRQGEKNGKN